MGCTMNECRIWYSNGIEALEWLGHDKKRGPGLADVNAFTVVSRLHSCWQIGIWRNQTSVFGIQHEHWTEEFSMGRAKSLWLSLLIVSYPSIVVIPRWSSVGEFKKFAELPSTMFGALTHVMHPSSHTMLQTSKNQWDHAQCQQCQAYIMVL